MSRHWVHIVRYGEDGKDIEVVRCMGPMSERKAERVDGGVNINLNHVAYYSVILDEREHAKCKNWLCQTTHKAKS